MTVASWARHETDAYSLVTDRFGFYTLTRKSDGASAFFQGDDARLWARDIDDIEDAWILDEERLNKTFDFLCSGYDDILESR